MVCTCGHIRIITKQRVLCPKCENLSIEAKSETINKLKDELRLLQKYFLKANNETNYNQSFGSAIYDRECAAQVILHSPRDRCRAIEEWITFTWLLHNLKFVKKGTLGCSNYVELVDLSRKITKLYNRLYCIEQDKAVVILVNGKETFEWTENEPLTFVPEEALTKTYSQTIFEVSNKYKMHSDIIWLQEGLMAPIHIWLLSEEIARLLKQSYHARLFPDFKKHDISVFSEISQELSNTGLKLNFERNMDLKNQCFLSSDKTHFKQFKDILFSRNIPENHVDWYMKSMLTANSDPFKLSSAIIVKDEEKDSFWIPLYTLQMLAIATMKHMNTSSLGHAQNNKGEIVEEHFFSIFATYEVSLRNPHNHKTLIRVKHPDKPNCEIADLMCFNDKYLVVMECKFWNSPKLDDLESELKKFKNNIDYIQTNLSKFSFPPSLKVIPLFYTPYTPYADWNGITLLNSSPAVIEKLQELFSERKNELLTETEGLEILFSQCTSEPLPFPLDAAEVNTLVQPDTFRIQDGIIWDFDDKEVTMIIGNPIGLSAVMLCLDITKQIFEELKQKDLQKGDIIRMIIVNLNGSWIIVQLARLHLLAKKKLWQQNVASFREYRQIFDLFQYIIEKERNRVNNE